MVAFSSEPTGWQSVSNEGGLKLEVQSVKGTNVENVRITLSTSATPTQFMDALWGDLEDRSKNKEVVKREIFENGTSSRRYWDLVRSPPVSDRDYIMQATRALDETTGIYSHAFETISDERKPVKADVVRMTVRGRCIVTPRAQGGSDVVYEIFTDVAGAVPTFLTRGPSRKAAIELLREVKRRAEK